MPRFNRKTMLKLIGVAVAAILVCLGLQLSMSTASASDKQGGVTVTKLEANADSQVGFKISTTLKSTALLFAKPEWQDYTEDDFVYQPKGTESYRLLPKVKPGTSARWEVHAYNPKTTEEIFVKAYKFNNYKVETKALTFKIDKKRQTEVYLEIHPKKGGSLGVKSVRVKVTSIGHKSARWVTMTHAYTDEETGVRVYVRTLNKGTRVHAVDSRTVYGSMKSVTVGSLGD